jgi:hypothetical protein
MTCNTTKDTSETQAVSQAEHIATLAEVIQWAQDNGLLEDLSPDATALIVGDLACTLDTSAEEDHDWDDIREAADTHLRELPLSVEVRSGWVPYGDPGAAEPEEFQILLCTGGPAVRIRGRFGNHGPAAAWFEHQDWGTPWTELVGVHNDTALDFACLLID